MCAVAATCMKEGNLENRVLKTSSGFVLNPDLHLENRRTSIGMTMK